MDQNDALHKPIKRVSKQRADGQKSGLAGEFVVAAELLKRGLQTSLTLGNAKSIDLFAINDQGSRFTIQVKALRSPNYFLIDMERVQDAYGPHPPGEFWVPHRLGGGAPTLAEANRMDLDEAAEKAARRAERSGPAGPPG